MSFLPVLLTWAESTACPARPIRSPVHRWHHHKTMACIAPFAGTGQPAGNFGDPRPIIRVRLGRRSGCAPSAARLCARTSATSNYARLRHRPLHGPVSRAEARPRSAARPRRTCNRRSLRCEITITFRGQRQAKRIHVQHSTDARFGGDNCDAGNELHIHDVTFRHRNPPVRRSSHPVPTAPGHHLRGSPVSRWLSEMGATR